MKQNRIIAFLFIFLSFISCTQTQTIPHNQSAKPETNSSQTKPNSSVQDFITQWLNTQNKNDFTAYQSLYADRFTGIRRSGEKTVSLNRETWMKDRKRMFEHPMKVETKDLKSFASGETTIVRFKQTWSSAAYQDEGPKEMVLIKNSQGDYRIAREEMLRSQKKEMDYDLKSFFVLEQGIVLDLNPSEDWGKAPPHFYSYEDVREDVDMEKLPVALQQMKNRSFILFDANGKSCETKISKLFLLKRVHHHFGTIQVWENGTETEDENGKKIPPLTKEEIAKAIWGGDDGLLLMGQVDSCKDSLWARDASLKIPPIIPAKPANVQWRKLALEQFRKLPPYKDIQKDYETYESNGHKNKGRWEEQKEDGKLDILLMQSPLMKHPWLSVSAKAGIDCGEFYGELFALWEVDDSVSPPKFKLLNKPEDDFYAVPRLLGDMDGEGHFEIFYTEPNPGTFYWKDGFFQEYDDIEEPDYDCGC